MDSRADGVETDAFAGMDHREFSGHRENGTLYTNTRVGFGNRGSIHEPTFEAVSTYDIIGQRSIVRSRYHTITRTCYLGRGSTHDRDETRSVDDAPTWGQTLLWVSLVFPHGEDAVFAPPPHALDVDLHC